MSQNFATLAVLRILSGAFEAIADPASVTSFIQTVLSLIWLTFLFILPHQLHAHHNHVLHSRTTTFSNLCVVRVQRSRDCGWWVVGLRNRSNQRIHGFLEIRVSLPPPALCASSSHNDDFFGADSSSSAQLAVVGVSHSSFSYPTHRQRRNG